MIEYKYNTFASRFSASLVDGILLYPFSFFGGIVYTNWPDYYIPYNLFLVVSWFIYSIMMHYYKGQTLGKILMNIRVVNSQDLNRIHFIQAIRRDAIYIFFEIIFWSYYFASIKGEDLNFEIFSGLSLIYTLVIFVWSIIELLTTLTNNQRRSVHDYIAGTVVIKIASETNQEIA